jgi:hypothetical protein
MSRSAARLSEADREQRRARERERLKHAVEQLLSSEGWQQWVRARARNGLARYSVSNLCLILLAKPEASFVAGFKAWLELGYCVRKGERAIRIFAPMTLKNRDALTGDDSGEQRVLFRAVSVFDRTQVAPIEDAEQAPLEAPCKPLCGDSHADLLAPAADLARSLGYMVSFEQTPEGTGGWCDRKTKRIVVDESLPANGQLRTLIHETAHALGVDYQRYSREQAEVIVDTVTFIVCSSVGLAVDGETLPYVAGWGESGALEAVSEFAHTIDALARRIEDALNQPATHAGGRRC